MQANLNEIPTVVQSLKRKPVVKERTPVHAPVDQFERRFAALEQGFLQQQKRADAQEAIIEQQQQEITALRSQLQKASASVIDRRDDKLTLLLRRYYKGHLSKEEKTTWEFGVFVNDGRNPTVIAALQDFIRQLPEEEKESYWVDEFVYIKCRTQFKSLKAEYKRSEEEREKVKKRKRDYKRRSDKCQKRKAVFHQQPILWAYFAGAEHLLDVSLMSDEEDVMEDDYLVGKIILRPHCRSDRANAFLEQLSVLGERSRRSKRARQVPVPQEIVLVNKDIKRSVLARLPAEAKRE